LEREVDVTLVELLLANENYKTENHVGCDKESRHQYCSTFYDPCFFKFHNKRIKLLEIGIAAGSSLALWRDYFPLAEIYGVDIQDSVEDVHKNIKNCYIFAADAYQNVFAQGLPEFDIIIDDGSHLVEHQIKCLDLYLPKLKNGGVLVIEDIQDPSFVDLFKNFCKDHAFTHQYNSNHTKHTDSNIFAIWKK